jgi:hypothetical protein
MEGDSSTDNGRVGIPFVTDFGAFELQSCVHPLGGDRKRMEE